MSNSDNLTGLIVHGDGRGRSLGFPTANLTNIQGTPPQSGIYACWGRLNTDKQWYKAVMHSGPRPAVGDPKQSIEVYLLDFPDHDLYGQSLECRNLIYLRAIKNFATLEDLKRAIAADCNQARALL